MIHKTHKPKLFESLFINNISLMVEFYETFRYNIPLEHQNIL